MPWPAGDPAFRERLVRTASGLRMRAVECGPESGEPVVFLHGWGCSAYMFCRNMPALAQAGWRAVAVDLKGHGLSDKPLQKGEYSLDSMTRSVMEALDALAIGRTAVVGHSLGGRIALRLAREAPQRVTALALLSAVGLQPMRVGLLIRLGGRPELARTLPFVVRRPTVWAALRFTYGDPRRMLACDVDQLWLGTRDPLMQHALQATLREFSWEPASADELRLPAIPVLVIAGSRDRLFRPREARELRALLPGLRVVRIEGAGHAANLENPELVNRALVTWLGESQSVEKRGRAAVRDGSR